MESVLGCLFRFRYPMTYVLDPLPSRCSRFDSTPLGQDVKDALNHCHLVLDHTARHLFASPPHCLFPVWPRRAQPLSPSALAPPQLLLNAPDEMLSSAPLRPISVPLAQGWITRPTRMCLAYPVTVRLAKYIHSSSQKKIYTFLRATTKYMNQLVYIHRTYINSL